MRSYRRSTEPVAKTSTPAKDVFLLCAILTCLHLYVHRVERAEFEPAAMAQPQPVQKPKLYYHSPLSAPAMPISAYTGMGYFSPDPVAHFDLQGNAVEKGAVATAEALNWGDESESQTIKALQSVYKLPKGGVPRVGTGLLLPPAGF